MTVKGLEPRDALHILHRELSSALARCHQRRSPLTWMKEAWLPGSARSLFRITSLVYTLLLVLALIATRNSSPELVSAAVMLVLMTLNLFLSGWESYQRSVEMFKRAEHMIELVKQVGDEADWSSANYPHLHTPLSASIVLQWTVRGGVTVNLPWALLVTGDTILIKPRQTAPARCKLDSDDHEVVLDEGDVYAPVQDDEGKQSSVSADRFVLLETPYIKQLELVLEKATDKPLSLLMKQRHFLISSMMEYILTPIVLILVLAWNCFRHMYSWSWVSGQPMSQLFLTEPVTALMPLINLMFPIWWVLVNTAALANVLTIFRQAKVLPIVSADPFDDTVDPPDMEVAAGSVSLQTTWNTFWSCFLGKGEHLCRSENILHCLGTVTSFCCTDKKGILSWPNTSPEKLFFLKKVLNNKDQNPDHSHVETGNEYSLVPEILTISQDHNNPYQLQFDDPNWRRHLPSLKPLGLSVLLNTCNVETEEKYTDFYHFLVSKSNQTSRTDTTESPGPDLLPIPSRGCLCQLSHKIGIPETLENQFELVQQLQSYRPLGAEATDASFTKNLTIARLKFPFPHQVSVLAREVADGRLSLLSQGTADVVLDSCVDAWSGTDLSSLPSNVRKKISEFYQRASLTSYCTSFAYKPLLSVPADKGIECDNDKYIELPTFLPSMVRSQLHDLDSVSVSSLNEEKLQQELTGDVLTTLHSQTFLGMVQMQYQAMVDMVQFIDLLEKACIRFVHFSKENELRSRVFSEKMGLESGWNCHISLHCQTEGDLVDVATPAAVQNRKQKILKKFKSSSINRMILMNSSVPSKLNQDWRLFDISQWNEASQPLLKGKLDTQVSDETNVGSISSMLEYDMNNRAQLPTGIQNIRPHLEQMDNVPLLVGLFTDCTPDTTREMLEILQENSEVVAVIGSSANYHNMGIFLTADASLAVEPLYPQVCWKVPTLTSPANGLSPTELAGHMIGLASSVTFKREEEVSVYRAIIRSRRHVLAIRHGLHLWTSCCMFLSSLVLCCLLILLPSPLSPPQMLVITLFYIPLLSTASFFSAYDSNISNISTGKNKNVFFSKSTFWHSVWCYGMRFQIAFIAVFLSHILSMLHLNSSCLDESQCFKKIAANFSFVTDTNMTFLTFYLVCISFSFVSRTDHLWQYRIKRSWHIAVVASLILVMQSGYFLLKCLHINVLDSVPLLSWVILGTCIPIQLFVNELVKRHEIKVNVRFQKRARLDFNTKLGINSPF